MFKNNLKTLFFLFFFFFFISKNINAEIRINEIYPAPLTGESEWIELYNNENVELNLSDYLLKDLANNLITLSGTIEPFGYHIATSSSILNNSGDTIYVLKNGIEIDTVQYGSTTFDYSFSRCPDGIDPFSKTTVITKNLSNNSICEPTFTPTETPTPSPSPTPILTDTPTATPTSTPLPSNTPTKILTFSPTSIPSQTLTQTPIPTLTPTNDIQNIYISEIYPYPNLGESEWIELFNNNTTDVTLTAWSIDDIENAGSSPKRFTLSMLPKSYTQVILPSSMYNNDGDSIRLINSQGVEIDSLEYHESQQGFSFGRNNIESDEICKQNPTPNIMNEMCLNPTSTPTETPAPIPTVTKTPTNTKTPTPPKDLVSLKPDLSNSSVSSLSEKNFTVGSSFVEENQSAKPTVLSAYTDNPDNKPPIEFFSLSGILLSSLNIVYMIKKLLL